MTRSTKASPAFNTWLQAQLKARRLTQRQLARKAGVDHSTVSRLLRGDRVPSLQTAALLARGLGWPEASGGLDEHAIGARFSSMARVEYALRSDDQLDERGVRAIMDRYLAIRLGNVSEASTTARKRARVRTPVPVVTPVSRSRPLSRAGSSPSARPRHA